MIKKNKTAVQDTNQINIQNKQKKKLKKPRTSKIIMWLFIALFIYVIYQGVQFNFSGTSYTDTAIFCACITAVGGIVGAIVTKYYNNSNAENIPRIQMNLYKESMKIRLEYNEKMMKLKKQYSMTDSDVYDIENQSNMDEVSDNILNTAISELDNKAAQSHEDVNVNSY